MSDARFSFLQDVALDGQTELARLLNGTIIRICVGNDAITSLAGQVLVYQLATLVARLFDRVELCGDDLAAVLPGVPLSGDTLLPSLRVLLPTLRPPEETGEHVSTVTVALGSPAVNADIFLGCSGWGARFSTSENQDIATSTNTIGALAAGALGAAELFKRVFAGRLKGAVASPGYALSLLDYSNVLEGEPALPEQSHYRITQFGCGSIGCALLLGMLSLPHVQGEVVLVDNGQFDARNPYKYVLLDWESGAEGTGKAVWSQQQVLRHARGRLAAYAFRGTVTEYLASLPVDYGIGLAVSAVDTNEARFQIQDTLPRSVINAGIAGTIAEVSVHGFLDGPCLACLGMQRERESWSARPIAQRTGLSPERVHELIVENEPLSAADLAVIRERGQFPAELMAGIETFLAQPLISLWNRLPYSETAVQTGTAAVPVTTAFVSAFAGVLLLAEVVKHVCPGLKPFRVTNSYRYDLLGVPAGGVFQYERDPTGHCLCGSSFRGSIYREKYLREGSESC